VGKICRLTDGRTERGTDTFPLFVRMYELRRKKKKKKKKLSKGLQRREPNSVYYIIYFEAAVNFILLILCPFSIIFALATTAYTRLCRFVFSDYGSNFNYLERCN
jgi:hypothetical protein